MGQIYSRQANLKFLKDLQAGKATVYDLPGTAIVRHWYGYNDGIWYDASGHPRIESQIVTGRNIYNVFHISTGYLLANSEDDVDMSMSEWIPTRNRVPIVFNPKHFCL